MPNPPWPHRTIIQLTTLGVCDTSAVVSTHYFQVGTAREATLVSDTMARAAAAELAADWVTSMKGAWLGIKTTDYTMTMLRSQVVERPGNFQHKLTPTELASAGGAGTSGFSAGSSLTDCCVVRWRTEVAGKSHRGRTYVGPLAASWAADGRVNSTGITAVTVWAEAMKARWAVGGVDHNDFALTVYSKSYNHTDYGYVRGHGPDRTFYFPPEYAGNATNVADYALDPILRTQRRRQVGVGA